MSTGKAPSIKPDFDTDVLWKPVRLGNRMRTTSMESSESGSDSRRTSFNEGMSGPEVAPRTRKLSITEMIFGAPGKGGFSWGQGNLSTPEHNKESITNDERFKELLKRESMILNDEGAFSRKSYDKK